MLPSYYPRQLKCLGSFIREASMMAVHHISCGYLHKPPSPRVGCHCLLLEGGGRLVLVDSGIGLLEVGDPDGRLGRPLIDAAGWQFAEANTAVRQVERLGFRPADVTDIVLTHADPDHAGGLADFPHARVHVGGEELAAVRADGGRYVPLQFAHGPGWHAYPQSDRRWFGLEARRVELGPEMEVLLVPLFGHTVGHCGVAVRRGDRWLLHAGDAYYLRVELATDDHPVSRIASLRAEDDGRRQSSLAELRRLARDHAGEVEMFGYHDLGEFPAPPA
jgi:glyoxylase-like metal-dependent hydrolase (beta-lactamase superfamily II)